MIVERAGGYFEMNRPFPNFFKALPQSESWCSSFHILVIISHMYTKFCGLALSYAKEKVVCSMVVKSFWKKEFNVFFRAIASTGFHHFALSPSPPPPFTCENIQSINQSINQSTLFKHGKWLSKLVFRHAV